MPRVRKFSEAARALLIERLLAQINFRPGWLPTTDWRDADIAFWCRYFKIDISEVERNADS